MPPIRPRALALALALALTLAVTAGSRAAVSPASLTLYVEPLPAGAPAGGLRLERVLAVRGDGTEVELDLHLDRLAVGDTARTRLLASGEILPGAYVGIRLQMAAALSGAPSGTEISPGGEPAPLIPFEFLADPDRPAIGSLAMRHGEPAGDDADRALRFVARRPQRPAVEAFGVVSIPGADRIVIFDRVSGAVVDQVATGRGPVGLAIDSRDRRAYVACAGEEVLQAIDLRSGAVVASRRLRVGDAPTAVALTPDGRSVLVANAGSATVAVYDAPALAERTRIDVGSRPSYLVVDSAGARAFVFDEMGDAVSVLDLASATVAAAVASEGGPFRGALDAGGERLYVIHRTSPWLEAIDTETLEVVGQVYVGPGATALTVDRRRDRILVGLSDPPRVEVFDAFSLLASDTLDLPTAAAVLTPDDQENHVCMSLAPGRTLRLVGLVGRDVVATIELPGEPGEVAFVSGR